MAASTAHAHPAKPVAKAPAKAAAKAAPANVRSAHKPVLAAAHASAKAPLPAHKQTIALAKPAARSGAKDRHGRLVTVARQPEPRNAAPRNAVHAHAVAPAPEPEEKPLEPIIVNHDRKRHYTPDPAAADGSLSPVLYNRRGRLIMPAALKGSHEILLHQNTMADAEGLDRIQDDDDLDDMRGSKLLVPLPSLAGLETDERLPANRRYCRPWTALFLTMLAQAHYAKFHSALQVNSAVRTVEFQRDLITRNGNAAPAEGETASPHLTGQAVDLGKKGLSLTEIAWLRGYLLPLVQAGKVDVEEEFQQACFHISVYRKYVTEPVPRRDIVMTHHVTADALATAIR